MIERARGRVFAFRNESHRRGSRIERPEFWSLYKKRRVRAFSLSNWTELDVWQYTHGENVLIVPLHYSARRPVVKRDGMLIVVDDRLPLAPGESCRDAGSVPRFGLPSVDVRPRDRGDHGGTDAKPQGGPRRSAQRRRPDRIQEK